MNVEQLPGHILAGYQLLEVLGRGGMSIVFVAQRVESPQDKVAIKILIPAGVAMSDEFVSFQARFLREAQAVHQLRHDHILPVLSYGEEDDLFYMVMPLMSGGTLAQRLAATRGAMLLGEIADYLRQLASAVDYANQRGMVHRDIKPSNVLLDERGNVCLADFGIVRLFDSSNLAVEQTPTTLTTTGKVYGTPAYMAPERFRGEPAVPATDIYALGILLYQLVTGQLPFKADNPLTLGIKHLNEEPLSPRALRPDLPEPAGAAILKALAKQPVDRFATASSLAAAFDAGLKGQWAEDLLPLPAVLAASLLETQAQHPAPPVAPLPGAAPDRLVLGPAPEAPGSKVPLAFAPTSLNAPAVARAASHPRSHFQAVTLVAMAVVLLLLAGLLALAVSHLAIPGSPRPDTHPVPTSTSGVPTRSGTTPTTVPSAGVTPTSSPATTPTSGPSPTPTTRPSPTPTPSPTSPSTPSPSPSSPPPSPTQSVR